MRCLVCAHDSRAHATGGSGRNATKASRAGAYARTGAPVGAGSCPRPCLPASAHGREVSAAGIRGARPARGSLALPPDRRERRYKRLRRLAARGIATRAPRARSGPRGALSGQGGQGDPRRRAEGRPEGRPMACLARWLVSAVHASRQTCCAASRSRLPAARVVRLARAASTRAASAAWRSARVAGRGRGGFAAARAAARAAAGDTGTGRGIGPPAP